MALSADRAFLTKEIFYVSSGPVKGGEIIFSGATVARGTDGYLVPASDATGLVVVGVAMDHVDNDNGQDGDKRCRVIHGIVSMANDGSPNDADITDVGTDVYVKADEAISTSGGSHNIVAGELIEIDAEGVLWVKFA